jgi:hypothetical protein
MSITAEQAAALVAKAVADATAPLVDRVAALAAPPAAPTPPAVPEPKQFSRAELDQAVTAGRITEAEATALWDKQAAEQTVRLVRDTVREAVQATTQQKTVETQIEEYATLKPDVLKPGTVDRERVTKQYNYLVSIGQPATKSTELAALGMVYGPLEGLKAARSGRPSEETHEEVGGGAPSGDPADSDGPKTKLSAREKAHYQNLINRGLYNSWADVDKELEFSNSRVRANARSRAA